MHTIRFINPHWCIISCSCYHSWSWTKNLHCKSLYVVIFFQGDIITFHFMHISFVGLPSTLSNNNARPYDEWYLLFTSKLKSFIISSYFSCKLSSLPNNFSNACTIISGVGDMLYFMFNIHTRKFCLCTSTARTKIPYCLRIHQIPDCCCYIQFWFSYYYD